MLAARVQQTALRQCSRTALMQHTSLLQLRALSTKPASHQSAWSSTQKGTSWIEGRRNGLYYKLVDQTPAPKGGAPEEIWKQMENDAGRLPPPNNAYSGRSVPVFRGDIAPALASLSTILRANAVRRTNVQDERHEKKGEKRNRLKSMRWRKRFAHEVRKRVQLVNEIRARGA